MISSGVVDLYTARLRRLAQSGLPQNEIAASIQQLMEAERTRKQPSDAADADGLLPFFSGRKAHLNVV